MKIKVTNRLGLPEPIVRAISNDPYDAGDGDYTITRLLKPPRAAQIARDAEIVEDAADRLFAMQGQMIHSILERAAKELGEEGYIVEKRFKTTYAVNGHIFRVSAQVDLFDPAKAILSDYKYTSVNNFKYGLKEEHRLQLNFQAELLRRTGFQVNEAEVVLLLRDWSAEREYEGYPISPSQKHIVPLMTSEEVNAWIVERIKLHEAAKTQLPQCTDEERWSRPTFAVMKSLDSQKAIRVFDSLKIAEEYITAKGLQAIIVKRPGQSRNCLRYCPVRTVCEQAKQYRSSPIVDEDGFIKL